MLAATNISSGREVFPRGLTKRLMPRTARIQSMRLGGICRRSTAMVRCLAQGRISIRHLLGADEGEERP